MKKSSKKLNLNKHVISCLNQLVGGSNEAADTLVADTLLANPDTCRVADTLIADTLVVGPDTCLVPDTCA